MVITSSVVQLSLVQTPRFLVVRDQERERRKTHIRSIASTVVGPYIELSAPFIFIVLVETL
jgi:hypothetical protein